MLWVVEECQTPIREMWLWLVLVYIRQWVSEYRADVLCDLCSSERATMSRCVSVGKFERVKSVRDAQTQTDDATAAALGFEPEGGGGAVCAHSYGRGADTAGAGCCPCVCAAGAHSCGRERADPGGDAPCGPAVGPVEEWERVEVSPETVRRMNLDAVRRLGGGPEVVEFLGQFHCPQCGARKDIICLDGDRALQKRYGVYFGGTLFLCPQCGHETVNKDL